jgi:NADPH:quinone reductase-like Zn-dependent oxidoreductase
MRAVRLHGPNGPSALAIDEVALPELGAGEVLVRVHAAAITRDELQWPVDRLPAVPSYELSGVVAGVGQGVESVARGDAVYALTPFDRDGVAAEYAAVPAMDLAPKPRSVGHVEAAAVPMAGLSAWQGLFVHGRLTADQRVLVLGATGGVGHIATQLARWRGAHVIGAAAGEDADAARRYGATEVIDRSMARFESVVAPVDLVFDTSGGDALARSVSVLRDRGRLVSIADETPPGVAGTYFVVEPDREQLIELARLVDDGAVRPAIDSVFGLADAAKAFDRVMSTGKRGKVVLQIGP